MINIKKSKLICTLVLIILGLFKNTKVNAQFWSSVGNLVKGGVSAVKQSIAAPAQMILASAKNPGDIRSIYQPVVHLAQLNSYTVVNGVNVIVAPETYMLQQAQKYSKSQGGKKGEFLFDIGNFMQQYSIDLGINGIQQANGILNGENPFQIVAAPLAAAIHAARERYYDNSKPIPNDVKLALKSYFDQNTLNRARYAVGSVEIALPNLVIQGRRLFGSEDWAVTVDDIIVFPRYPGDYLQACEWWAHELTHVQQYMQWTVETFAYNYVKDYHSVERPAYANAENFTNRGHCLDEQELIEHQEYISQKESEINNRIQEIQGYQPTVLYPNEKYITQCVFPNDTIKAMFLITNMSRIIAVNPFTGESMHVGYANPPRLYTMAWSFDLPDQSWQFEVGFDNHIYALSKPIYYGSQLIGFQTSIDIGRVQNL